VCVFSCARIAAVTIIAFTLIGLCVRIYLIYFPLPVCFNNVRAYTVLPGIAVRDRWVIIGSRCDALETAPSQFPTGICWYARCTRMIRFPRGKLRSGRFRNSVQAYRSGLDRTGRSRDSLSSVDYRVSRNEIERVRIASSSPSWCEVWYKVIMRRTISQQRQFI